MFLRLNIQNRHVERIPNTYFFSGKNQVKELYIFLPDQTTKSHLLSKRIPRISRIVLSNKDTKKALFFQEICYLLEPIGTP